MSVRHEPLRRGLGGREPAARLRAPGRYGRVRRYVVLPADGAGRRGAAVGRLRGPPGPDAGKPDGLAVLLQVAAAGRPRAAAAGPRGPRGRRRDVRGRPAGLLPAAVGRRRRAPPRSRRPGRRAAFRSQRPLQHRFGHAPVTAHGRENTDVYRSFEHSTFTGGFYS